MRSTSGRDSWIFGITGRDLAAESDAPVRERLALGFGSSTFRYAAPAGRDWTVGDLAGKRIATAFPNLVRKDLTATRYQRHRDPARRRGGDLGRNSASPTRSPTSSAPVAPWDCTTWSPSASPLCDSEAVLIERRPSRRDDDNAGGARDQLAARVQGVVFGQQYLMLDYDCPRTVLDAATAVTPGLESPTIAPLADPAWVAVRALVPRRDVNAIMDELAAHRRQGNTGLRHQVLPLLIRLSACPCSPC